MTRLAYNDTKQAMPSSPRSPSRPARRRASKPSAKLARPMPIRPLPAPRPPGAPPGVPPFFDRYAHMTGEQLIAEVHARREQVAVSFYSMGLVLRELARPERYRLELGFETFEDLVEARYLTSRITAMKLIAVASTFPEPQARMLGVEKSYALLRYASIQGSARDAVRLVATNAVIEGEPVERISLRELVEAARHLKERLHPPEPSEDEGAARRAARALQAWLRREGARSASASAQRHGGAWQVRVHLSATDAARLAGAG